MPVSTFKIIACVLFTLLGVLTLRAASHITGAAFDPIGSQAVPYTLGGLLLLLLAADTLTKNTTETESDEPAAPIAMLRIGLVLGLSVIYCAGVFVLAVPFSLATLVFVPLASYALLPDNTGRAHLMRLLTGAVIGFGGELLFTKIFFVDIPGMW